MVTSITVYGICHNRLVMSPTFPAPLFTCNGRECYSQEWLDQGELQPLPLSSPLLIRPVPAIKNTSNGSPYQSAVCVQCTERDPWESGPCFKHTGSDTAVSAFFFFSGLRPWHHRNLHRSGTAGEHWLKVELND